MSSQHQYMTVNNTPSTRVGDIEHISHLSEHIGSLCLSSEYSDVTLIVEGQRIPAHKVILAASSDYFRALLYGGMREANQAEVELQAPLQAFKALLRYVYSGHMGLSLLREDTVLDMLGLAHQFNFQELEAAISDYLRQVLALRNVCAVLDAARLYGLDALMDYCYNFLDRNATEVLQHDSFLQLSVEALQGLLERDSFFAPEVDIFKAVCRWFEANQQWVKSESGQAQVEKILRCVRLTLMSLEELLRVVRPFAPVTPDMLLDAIHDKTRTRTTDLRHRGLLLPEENVATLKRGARVIAGDMRSALLDGDTENYDMERGYTRHTISDAPDNPGILVRLPAPTIINHLRLLLWDRDNRSYAYFIEVSVDQKDWVRVVDHSKYYCRSWQRLYFAPRVVQFIRVVGTSNTVNKVQPPHLMPLFPEGLAAWSPQQVLLPLVAAALLRAARRAVHPRRRHQQHRQQGFPRGGAGGDAHGAGAAAVRRAGAAAAQRGHRRAVGRRHRGHQPFPQRFAERRHGTLRLGAGLHVPPAGLGRHRGAAGAALPAGVAAAAALGLRLPPLLLLRGDQRQLLGLGDRLRPHPGRRQIMASDLLHPAASLHHPNRRH
ncbi:BTB (POZ) domain containing 9 isoform X2 [Choristoneura fumiferana]|uniref:BTB (POZ) domain containing 9 isoform X2 n=1 Tax=Choristoneura fumiferana TaxID=7141 RepID=UPI003D15C236